MPTEIIVVNAPYVHRKFIRHVNATRLSKDVPETKPYKSDSNGSISIGKEPQSDSSEHVNKVIIDGEVMTVTNIRVKPVHETVNCMCNENKDHFENIWTFDEASYSLSDYLKLSVFGVTAVAIGHYIYTKFYQVINMRYSTHISRQLQGRVDHELTVYELTRNQKTYDYFDRKRYGSSVKYKYIYTDLMKLKKSVSKIRSRRLSKMSGVEFE